jgi:magnesium-transporting ATPase (P-type)
MGKQEDQSVAEHVSGQSNKPMTAPAHALPYEQVAQELGANTQDGLSHDDAKKRLEDYGRNEFGEGNKVSPVRIFVGQIANALTLVSQPLIFFAVPVSNYHQPSPSVG